MPSVVSWRLAPARLHRAPRGCSRGRTPRACRRATGRAVRARPPEPAAWRLGRRAKRRARRALPIAAPPPLGRGEFDRPPVGREVELVERQGQRGVALARRRRQRRGQLGVIERRLCVARAGSTSTNSAPPGTVDAVPEAIVRQPVRPHGGAEHERRRVVAHEPLGARVVVGRQGPFAGLRLLRDQRDGTRHEDSCGEASQLRRSVRNEPGHGPSGNSQNCSTKSAAHRPSRFSVLGFRLRRPLSRPSMVMAALAAAAPA